MAELRPYQRVALDAVRAAYIMGVRRVCLQLPTGAGKTFLAAQGVIAPAVSKGQRVLFVAHLDSLITDTAQRLRDDGIDCGIIQADREEYADRPVQVCSIQTLARRGLRPPANLVIVDECHHVTCESFRTFLEGYPRARVLGLTATPQRGDGAALGDMFDALVSGPTLRQLVDQGVLAEPVVYAPASGQGKKLDPVDYISEHEKNLIFVSTVAEAEDIRSRYPRKLGLIVGDTPVAQREAIRAGLRSGICDGIIGVNVFLEGFDEPTVTRLVFARNFGFVGTYLQAVGRGLRKCPGKSKVDIYDLAGNVFMHGLPLEDRAWSLDGEACQRSAPVSSVRRCEACLAVYAPSMVRCPRCGSEPEPKELPVYVNRAERLAKIESVPQFVRDRSYLRRLLSVAEGRMRMPREAAKKWALDRFRKQFRREPYSET